MKKLMCALMLVQAMVVAETSEPRHEITLGVAPLVGFGGRTTGGDVYTDIDGSFIASVAGNYDYAVASFLQLGVNTSFSYVSGSGGSATFLQLLGGPTLNLPLGSDWLYNSLFLALKGGVLLVDAGGSSTEVMLTGDFGYRLKLADHVTWRPSVGAIKLLDGSKFLFVGRPISFSFVF